jgi:O-antigen/teichoic acid export membrane protein
MRKYLLPLLLIFLTTIISACMPTNGAQGRSSGPDRLSGRQLNVFYGGPEGSVLTALELAGDFRLTTDQTQADVFIYNGSDKSGPGVVQTHPTHFDLSIATTRLRQGAGVVILLGPDLTGAQFSSVVGSGVNLELRQDPLSLVSVNTVEASPDPLLADIVWTSSPQVRDRWRFQTDLPGLKPLVTGFEDGSLVLGSIQVGQGRLFVFTPFLNGANPQIQDWAYFNYFIYALVERAAGLTPLSFADYPASPVPHPSEQYILMGILALLIALSFLLFFFVRRYSLAHPEALEQLVQDRQLYSAREASTPWEEIGFHRPLGGFLLALMVGLVFFIPLIVYQNLVLPVYILPSAQALGIWGRVTQFFNLTWYFFDMGTSIAFIKYLSEYRVHEPRKGIMYGQLFVWWQVLSGAIQVVLVVALASLVAPRTAYAIYAWSVIIHSFIQIPGFYQVFRHAVTGLQRFDYAQILDLANSLLLLLIIQPIVVALMFLWGKAHPIFGASMGGLLGLGVAAYLIELATFLIGYWLYRRLGYNTRLLFLAHFDWEVIRNSFKFGVFEMLGSIAWSAGQAAEIAITQARLVNYAEIWGNWGLAQNFVFSFQVISILLNNLMPSISEAISHGRKALSQYYSAMAYKYGGIFSAYIGAVLLAVADRFILGASGPEFVRAAAYAVPLIIWGAVQYPSWVGDNVQLAANRPYLKSALVTGEQVVRVILALILVQRFQINALIFAYFVGLLSKDFVGYFINHRVCYPQRFFAWQSLAAPLLAGTVHYLLLRWLTGLLWTQDQVTSVLIFFIGILPSFPVYMFFYGLFGGWDDATLEELRRSVPLSSFMKPLTWLLWASTALGARLTPLHGRFPISIRAAALKEAETLTTERVEI